MTIIHYYSLPVSWKKNEEDCYMGNVNPIQPAYVHSTLENVCTELLHNKMPEAWYWKEDEVCKWLDRLGLDVYKTVLHGICKLFDIRMDKRFKGPLEQPTVDPNRMFYWYRRKYELADLDSRPKAPLNKTEWLQENGYLDRHYRQWETLKYFNKLPFAVPRVKCTHLKPLDHVGIII